MSKSELACVYAALILADDGADVTVSGAARRGSGRTFFALAARAVAAGGARAHCLLRFGGALSYCPASCVPLRRLTTSAPS